MPRKSRSPVRRSSRRTRSPSEDGIGDRVGPSRTERSSRKRRHARRERRRSGRRQERKSTRSRRRASGTPELGGELERRVSSAGDNTTDQQRSKATESVSQLGEAISQGIGRLVQNLGVSQAERQVVSTASTSIIDEYNPFTHNITEWLAAVDEFAYIYGWSDRTICHLALSKLRGPAEVWYRALPTRIFTWPEWKKLLTEQFRAKRDLHADLTKMMQCVAHPNQSLYAYTFEKLSLIQKLKLPLSGEDQVNLILGGISNEQIKFSVETAGITEPSDLARHFKTLDERQRRAPLASPGVTGMETGKVSAGGSQGTSGAKKNTLRCYHCNKWGHIKKNCPQTTTQHRSKLPAIEYHVNYIAKNPNDKFYKTIKINGQEIKSYIDFGSECSLITQDAINQLQLQTKPCAGNVRLFTLAGNAIKPKQLVSVEITLDNIKRTIEFYVIEKCVLNVPVIGQNFTELYDISYIRTGSELTFTEDFTSHGIITVAYSRALQ